MMSKFEFQISQNQDRDSGFTAPDYKARFWNLTFSMSMLDFYFYLIFKVFWQKFSVKETRTVIKWPGMTIMPDIRICRCSSSRAFSSIGHWSNLDPFHTMCQENWHFLYVINGLTNRVGRLIWNFLFILEHPVLVLLGKGIKYPDLGKIILKVI
jgi:hypothetical protein